MTEAQQFKVIAGRSLFQTKTFRAGVVSFLTGVLPIILQCYYDERYPTVDEVTALIGLVSTLVFLISGRATKELVYTPDNLPGLNKSHFEISMQDLENYVKRHAVKIDTGGYNDTTS